MSGVKGRSGRKGYEEEKAIEEIIELSFKTIKHYLLDSKWSNEKKAQLATESSVSSLCIRDLEMRVTELARQVMSLSEYAHSQAHTPSLYSPGTLSPTPKHVQYNMGHSSYPGSPNPQFYSSPPRRGHQRRTFNPVVGSDRVVGLEALANGSSLLSPHSQASQMLVKDACTWTESVQRMAASLRTQPINGN